ncbi:MAG: HlyD family efflux transporter periplasmic adaptor subunit [Methylomonas sp.]|nr:HlyD family efflux transporter periplasmic adaptor subunit [Methylomonas sp.]
MILEKIKILILFMLLSLFVMNSKSLADQRELRPVLLNAVGALGRIEPRSRIISVSHNAGAEGVNIFQLLVQEGDSVRNGDVLAILADHDKKQADINAEKANIVALGAKLVSEKVNLNYAENEYSRYSSLASKSLASPSLVESKHLALQQSKATVRQLQAEIAVAQANLKIAEENLKNTVILAPMDGTILKIHSWPGERVGDQGLLEIADLSRLDAVAEVYESDLPKVRVGQIAEIRLDGIDSTYSGVVRELGFQVRKNDQNDTDPLADRDNRVIEVRLTLDDQAVADLKHQIYRQVRVRIKL